MSLIDDYEQQYADLTADVTALIGRLDLYGHDEKREISSRIDTHLSEAQELLEQIGLEIRDAPPANRSSLTKKLSCYQAELKRLQNEYKTAQEKLKTNYNSIDDFDDVVNIKEEQKQRLLDNSERLERTGNRLEQGYRIVLETEQIGTQVLQDLHHQRETIQSARSKIRETNAELGRTSRLLNSMMLRALQQKVVLYGIGSVFIVVILLSIYFKITK